MRRLLTLLPRPVKRRLRSIHRVLIGRWRRYPLYPAKQRLADVQADRILANASLWHRSITPIPDRGDEKTRANRIHNLNTAIDIIHNHAIAPGQAFSLSNLIGEPTKDRGYREGPAFIKGEVRSDVGGGLCLIATNLYQLFLHSGCKIIERHNHSIDAYGGERFYKLGEDAAISHGSKDLVIRNTSPVRLILRMQILGSIVESRLYGIGKNPALVQVESIVLEKISPQRPQTHPGWTTCTMRFTRENQALTWHSDYTSISHYKPF